MPPKKGKKNPKYLKCSLTRAKTKTIKESWLLLSPSFFLSLSLCLSLSTQLEDHDIGVEL